MNCEVRARLLDELSFAVAEYNRAVNRMINQGKRADPILREMANQAREECAECRAALLEHEREHGCVATLALI